MARIRKWRRRTTINLYLTLDGQGRELPEPELAEAVAAFLCAGTLFLPTPDGTAWVVTAEAPPLGARWEEMAREQHSLLEAIYNRLNHADVPSELRQELEGLIRKSDQSTYRPYYRSKAEETP